MKAAKTNAWLYSIAALLAAIALALTARTVSETPRALTQLARRHGELLQLQGMAERNAVNREALQAFEASSNSPPDLAAWCREQAPNLAVEISDRETLPLLPGWSVRRVDVRLADVTLAEVGQLLTSMEALRPPWRMAEAQLTAGGGVGHGRASLVMEALVRRESGTKP